MFWRKKLNLNARWKLEPSHTFAGIIIGDNWVQAVVVHVDPMGAFYPIKCVAVEIDIPLGQTPPLEAVVDAIETAWQQLVVKYRVEYNKFFVCLPPWCCQGRRATAQIDIEFDSRVPWFRCPTIKRHHLRQLRKQICTLSIPEEYVVTDLLPHYYVLDNGRKTPDPLSNTSRTLRMEAHLFLAERGVVRALLKRFGDIGLHVDAMMSPWTAATGIMSPSSKNKGTVLVDVGRRNTCLTFYQDANIGYSCRLPVGSDDVKQLTADRMRITPADLCSRVDDWGDRQFCVSPDKRIHSLPIFKHAQTHPAMRPYNDAAIAAVSALFKGLTQAMDVAQQEMLMNIQKIMFVGDDYLTVNALKGITEDKTDLPCHWEKPKRVHGMKNVTLLGYARALGAMRQGSISPTPHQVLIAERNEALLDIVRRRIANSARRIFWGVVHRHLGNTASVEPVLPGTARSQLATASAANIRWRFKKTDAHPLATATDDGSNAASHSHLLS